jgi:hypothetical protein
LTKWIVVTGCDAAHYELASDLLASLRKARGASITIGFVHIGDDSLPEAITSAVDHIAHVADEAFGPKPGHGHRLAQMIIKPRLPAFFPGFDVYIWLDGDTWVQNAVCLDQLVHCAGLADVAMHPEKDPNYRGRDGAREYLLSTYTSIYGAEDAQQYCQYPSLNTGVVAAAAASPVWRLWTEALVDVGERARGRDDLHFSDQIPLHRLAVSGKLSVCPLRAVNNWLVMFSPPAVNLERKRLMAPSFPFEEINIVHLVGTSKQARYKLGSDGSEITFRYRDIQALFDRSALA